MSKTQEFRISAPDIQVMKVTIVGTSPLIFHKWSEKAKREMLEKQMKKASANKAKEARDPETEYHNSFYRDASGFIAFPALNIKQAVVDSARNVEGLPMTVLRGAVFIAGDADGMIQVLHKGKPVKAAKRLKKLDEENSLEGVYSVDSKLPDAIQMREDMVRIGNGSADLRYRGQVKNWTMELLVKHNNDVLSAEQVLNLLQIAGFACGLGEWRPQKSGSFGTFEIQQ